MNSEARALIIGIAAYQSINKLPQAVINDAGDIYGILTDPKGGGYVKDNVHLITNFEATKINICQALKSLVEKARDEDTVIIYFSGHGGQLESGPYKGDYLLPVDTDFTSDSTLAETAISGDDFTHYIRDISARRLVVIFDCCHSGGIGTPKDVNVPALKIGLPEEYYERLKSGRGRVIISSSRSSEVSYIMPGERNSLFTKYLLEGLNGGAPGPSGVIRIFDLFHYLQPKVNAVQPKQHPIFKAEIEENFPVSLYRGGKSPAIAQAELLSDEFKYDVFISYRQKDPDKTWVWNTLVPQFETAGISVCVDYKCFRFGVPIVKEMERAVVASRYTLAILTPAYLGSNFTEFEQVMAEHLGLEQSQRRFLSVFREQCNPSLRIRARMWLDMTDDEEFKENIERLVYELKQPPNL